MVSGKPLPKRYVEVGGEPSYHITDVKFETSSDGNIIVYAYEERHGNQLRLHFSATVSPTKLVTMARQAMVAVAEIHNRTQYEDGDGTSH